MTDTLTDVLVAGYPHIDDATGDFEGLVALVKDKRISIEGFILVTHAETAPSPFGRRATTSVARGWAGAAVSASPWVCSRRRRSPRPRSGLPRAG